MFGKNIKRNHFRNVWGPTSGSAVTLKKTGRREMPVSNPGRACRPSRSEFSVVFSETPVNTGCDPFERPTYRPRSFLRQSALTPTPTPTPELMSLEILIFGTL